MTDRITDGVLVVALMALAGLDDPEHRKIGDKGLELAGAWILTDAVGSFPPIARKLATLLLWRHSGEAPMACVPDEFADRIRWLERELEALRSEAMNLRIERDSLMAQLRRVVDAMEVKG